MPPTAAPSSTAPGSPSAPASSLPPSSSRAVGWWLLALAALVFGIVVVGGLTRLTESGLSITEWQLFKGTKPPTSADDWEKAFAHYKQFPEYLKLKPNMTLEEFKDIYWWEWVHREIGRFIGVAFILPGLYFWRRRMMSATMAKKSLVIGALIGSQGVLGWLMVRSGLDPQLLEDPNAVPRVNQRYLAAHLGSAFLIYSLLLSNALKILAPRMGAVSGSGPLRSLQRFRLGSHLLMALIFTTALTGALVAGLDAGLVWNEWPTMGGEGSYVPPDYWALSEDGEQPFYRDWINNASAVQCNHRFMAYATLTGVAVMALAVARRGRAPIPVAARRATWALVTAVSAQATLGITTLLYLVPITLASLHQAGSLTLLTVSWVLVHAFRGRRPPL
ncbi:hypothetical protein CXG81DRAFT_9845 [Caulochytrium protostelioides]|uniref:Cytochrome oxidase assembly n=1 Tax=Caulochytrium protostelioides TaxID=1555241 RepID=A0A4P9XCK2_9FUNG|nr:hypothetical protein CXG81DRAFT_9845 [Caulochytrium protostelioides]|eukprot:RKP03187.1 hypothetical protein CXG81DRAFT_9845 [Caulochytrium protostelioides]